MSSNREYLTKQIYIENLEMHLKLYEDKLIMRNMQRHIDNLHNALRKMNPKIELEPIPLNLNEIFNETESSS